MLLSINGNIGRSPSITQDRPVHQLCNLGFENFIRRLEAEEEGQDQERETELKKKNLSCGQQLRPFPSLFVSQRKKVEIGWMETLTIVVIYNLCILTADGSLLDGDISWAGLLCSIVLSPGFIGPSSHLEKTCPSGYLPEPFKVFSLFHFVETACLYVNLLTLN